MMTFTPEQLDTIKTAMAKATAEGWAQWVRTDAEIGRASCRERV